MKRPCLLAGMLLAALTAGTAQTKMLKNFDQLMFALRTGSEVRAVIFYARCTLIVDSVETKGPDAVGGMSFGTYEYFGQNAVRNPKAYVSTSQTVLISHPKYGHVYNYVKVRVFEDNAVEIVVQYLNPATFQVVMNETFNGKISAGDDGNAVCLYER